MRTPLRITLKTLAILGVMIGIGLWIAQDQQTLKVRSSVPITDPRFAEYVAALMGTRTSSGNTYEVLLNGDQVYPSMLDAIRGARRRISFETYIYSAGEAANQFTEALAGAARRGVLVQIVVDAVGGSDVDRRHVERLRQAGCKLNWFNEMHWYTLEELNYRTHRKIMVVDGEVGFTGGIGVADHWLGHGEQGRWRDTQVRVIGPAARLLEAGFYENWIESGGEVKPILEAEPAATTGSTHSLVTLSSPTGGSNSMKLLYLLSIAGATRTVDIQSPYFVTDESTRWALEQAVKRGVKIRILVEGDNTDARAVKFASRDAYEQLLGWGIEIYEYQPTMMHVKALIADGIWSVFGSSNFDNRSFELNDELNVAVQDADLAARFTRDFGADLQRARRLTYEQWRARSFQEKAREKFWSFFGEVF